MLNNLTNFFNLIRGRKIKTTLDNSDLIPIGVRDPRFDGNYQPSAIEFADLQAQVGGLQTVAVDGITITGDGTPGNPLIATATGGALYSNTLFVDAINGDDTTAIVGDPNKAYKTITAALLAASGMGATTTNRVLVYVRRGVFNSVGSEFFVTCVDIYCEPGVFFKGNVTFRDPSPGVNSNFLGYAIFESSSINPFELNYTSTVNIEFDYMITTGRAFGFLPGLGETITANVKGNYIYSSTFGTAYGSTIRGNTNLTMNISRGIEAVHTVFYVANDHSGTVVINTPNIYLGVGNIYGGGAKNAIKIIASLITSDITVNANLVNKDTTRYAGAQEGMLTFYGTCRGKFRLNGNIIGGPQIALNGNNTAAGYCTINGDTKSSFDYTIWMYGSGLFRFLNGNHVLEDTSVGTAIGAVNGTAEVYFYNCSFYNPITGKDLYVINGASSATYFNNCTGRVVGGAGFGVSTTAGGGVIGFESTRFNGGLQIPLVDVYSPTGLIVDTNVKSLNF